MTLERPAGPPPGVGRILADLRGIHAANALVAFVFAASAIWLAPKPKRKVDASAGGH